MNDHTVTVQFDALMSLTVTKGDQSPVASQEDAFFWETMFNEQNNSIFEDYPFMSLLGDHLLRPNEGPEGRSVTA